MDRSPITRDAIIIGSHTVYRRKAEVTLISRIIPWHHRDREREQPRSDSPYMNLESFTLVLSITKEKSWPFGRMDISTASLRTNGFERIIYVRPTKEVKDKSGLLKPLADAYGLADSGRLW